VTFVRIGGRPVSVGFQHLVCEKLRMLGENGLRKLLKLSGRRRRRQRPGYLRFLQQIVKRNVQPKGGRSVSP